MSRSIMLVDQKGVGKLIAGSSDVRKVNIRRQDAGYTNGSVQTNSPTGSLGQLSGSSDEPERKNACNRRILMHRGVGTPTNSGAVLALQ